MGLEAASVSLKVRMTLATRTALPPEVGQSVREALRQNRIIGLSVNLHISRSAPVRVSIN